MERIRHRGLEITLGLAAVATVVVAVTLILVSFSGGFSNKITVHAQLAQAGDALATGDVVTYLNVIVGEVAGSTGKADGGAVVDLEIDPTQAAQIPAGVQAIAVPASLFGNTKVELVPPKNLGGARLRDGSIVQADTSPAAESLQTALANAYDLLTSVHPAQLDAALSALATALDGQGAALNGLIHDADSYLRALAPKTPELESTITSLADATDHLATDAPSLLSSLKNTLVVARGIADNRAAVSALLLIAPTALDNAQQLLNPTTVGDLITVIRNEEPVTAALAQQPTALADTIRGFKSFADAFDAALSAGPYLKANLIISGADFTQLAPVALGGQGTVFQSVVDPPEYTVADCPRYPGENGPNCTQATGRSAGAQLITSGAGYAGGSAVGSPQDVAAAAAAASAISGLPASQVSPVTADVLLGPLLRGVTTVINP